jgi:hypothetical protein
MEVTAEEDAAIFVGFGVAAPMSGVKFGFDMGMGACAEEDEDGIADADVDTAAVADGDADAMEEGGADDAADDGTTAEDEDEGIALAVELLIDALADDDPGTAGGASAWAGFAEFEGIAICEDTAGDDATAEADGDAEDDDGIADDGIDGDGTTDDDDDDKADDEEGTADDEEDGAADEEEGDGMGDELVDVIDADEDIDPAEDAALGDASAAASGICCLACPIAIAAEELVIGTSITTTIDVVDTTEDTIIVGTAFVLLDEEVSREAAPFTMFIMAGVRS